MVQVMPLLPLLTGDSQRAPFWGGVPSPGYYLHFNLLMYRFVFEVLQTLEQKAEAGISWIFSVLVLVLASDAPCSGTSLS